MNISCLLLSQKKSLISVSGTHRQVSYYMFMFLCIGPFEVPFKVIETSLSAARASGTQPGGLDQRCPPTQSVFKDTTQPNIKRVSVTV